MKLFYLSLNKIKKKDLLQIANIFCAKLSLQFSQKHNYFK